VELKRQLDAGEPVFIVDLRHPLEILPDPFTLPGALHFSPEALAQRHVEIPRDRDIVLFCTCPSEATAAKTAMALHKLGIERVRPLRGGFDEWRRLAFPSMRSPTRLRPPRPSLGLSRSQHKQGLGAPILVTPLSLWLGWDSTNFRPTHVTPQSDKLES